MANLNQNLAGRVPLNCVVFPAMFSTERKVVLEIEGEEYITFADEELSCRAANAFLESSPGEHP